MGKSKREMNCKNDDWALMDLLEITAKSFRPSKRNEKEKEGKLMS